MTDSADEVHFTVIGEKAHLAKAIRIEDLGLTEPGHLEKWVIQYPQALGSGVLIVASQYDRWISPNGTESHDRLDLLGLGDDGRLLVAELKRGRAPDTVELQAIKYAAMSSRFNLEQLGSLHADFLERTEQQKLTTDEATEKLQAHAPDVELSAEAWFRKPRIVLLAESFPDPVTTSVVWLAEGGIDITLRRYQAYQTAGGETILSVSQTYPPADIGSFVVGPRQGTKAARRSADLPEVPWSVDDFSTLIKLAFPVPIAVLNACSEKSGGWVPSAAVYERAGVTPQSGAGQLAGFGYSVRTRFGRGNPPWTSQWKAAGGNMNYYQVTAETAAAWLQALEGSEPDNATSAPDAL